MKEALSLRFSRSAKTYSKWAVPQRVCAKILVEFVKPEGNILDLGSGTGFISEMIEETKKIVGVDISLNMCREYSLKFPYVILGDVENLPFKDKSFDYVISNFTLHWTNFRKAIKEMIRVSKGTIAFAVPVKGSINLTEFPYPEEDSLIEEVRDLPHEWFIREVEIPFRGYDLIRFFHYTGSSLNPNRRKLHSKEELKKLLSLISEDNIKFRVLFLKALVY